MTIDRPKLAKILNLTTSDNDGEALNAVRSANAILKKANMRWDEVLAASNTTVIHTTGSAPVYRSANEYAQQRGWTAPPPKAAQAEQNPTTAQKPNPFSALVFNQYIRLCNEIMENPKTPPQTISFIGDLMNFLKTHRYLSEKQVTSIVNTHDRWGR